MERSLVERARSGDRDAFDSLVLETIDTMHRRALAILGNAADAEDVTQDAYVAAWRGLRTLREVERFDAWLGRILLNACRMRLRRGRGIRAILPLEGLEPGDELSAAVPSADDAVADADTFDRAFGRLSVEHRAVLVLHHLERRSVADIAQLLDVPPGTVKSRLHAARSTFARELSRERSR